MPVHVPGSLPGVDVLFDGVLGMRRVAFFFEVRATTIVLVESTSPLTQTLNSKHQILVQIYKNYAVPNNDYIR